MAQHMYLGVVVLGPLIALEGCALSPARVTAAAASSPAVLEKLQVVSSGHTGCLPEDNQISIVWAKADGSGLWKATCKGKTYLCSAVASTGGSEAFSCAPEAQ
jgi:hypothetical protein